MKKSKRIRIALIDTGVDATHPELKKAALSQYCIRDNKVEQVALPKDAMGHGTACAGIIHRLEPEAEIISVQCMDHRGMAEGEQILTALEWCVDQKIDIVNLSFGALSNRLEDRFSGVGRRAIENNMIVFAACHDSGYPSVPACLPEYLSVLGKSVKGRYSYYCYADHFIANAGRQRVCWINPRYILAEGTSFAAARMSAYAARIKRNGCFTKYEDILNALFQCAQEGRDINLPTVVRNRAVENNSSFFPIQKAALYSLTKEMHPLMYFPDLTNIEIAGIIEPPYKRKVSNPPFQNSSIFSFVPISDDTLLEEKLQGVDTLIISRTSAYEAMLQREHLAGILERAIQCKKNVYSLEYLDSDLYPDVFALARKNGCLIRHPMLSYDNLIEASLYRDMYGHISNETPVVGVFGTGTSQGKFTTQLVLRRLLKAMGYNVNNYGTETHSELFGFEGFYPLEMDLSVKFSQDEMIPYIQGDIRRMEIVNQPDIIIVGGQSGTVPHSYALKSSQYTLPTLAFLMATLPHAYILSINAQDDLSFIAETIQVIEGLGKAKVIAVSCASYRKVVTTTGVVNNIQLSDEEFDQLRNKILERFGLPVFNVLNIVDAQRLCDLVVEFFHDK